ncbi:MAG: hypothetical protein HYY05_04750 [Chloroflexi bacterium]|nr:hypothetical protein [Chloroflexota bacterium]
MEGHLRSYGGAAAFLLLDFLHSLRRNKGQATLALALSLLIWLTVNIEQNPQRTDLFPEPVPVRVVNVPGGLRVSGPVEDVRVRLTAPSDAWPRLERDSIVARLDLGESAVGVNEAAVRVEVRDSPARLVSVIPPRLLVRLEPARSKAVPIELNLLGSVPFGFSVEPPALPLEQATIEGPESVVNQVASASLDVELEGRRLDITQTVALVPRNSQRYEVQGISVDPPALVLHIPIRQQVFYRTVAVRPIVVGTPAPGHAIETIEVEPATISVAGARDAVESIAQVNTNAIPIGGAQGSIVSAVELALPKGAQVVGENRVIVRVAIHPVLGSRRILVAPQVTGLAPDARAVVEPDAVAVIVEGPVPSLEALRPSALRATLDLSRLEPGTHQVAPQIELPNGLRSDVVEPARVRVIISAVPRS